MAAQAKQLITLANKASSAALVSGPAVQLFQTSQGAGGAGRDVILDYYGSGVGVTVIVEGNPGNVAKTVPLPGDAAWAPLYTFNPAANQPLGERAIIAGPAFIRYRVSVVVASSTFNLTVQGVQ